MKEFKLEKGPKIEPGFIIPKHYFEHFSTDLIQKIEEENQSKAPKLISIFRNRKQFIVAAAAVLLIAILIPFAYRTQQKNQEMDALTIENYLAQEGNLNQYELIGEIDAPNSNLTSAAKELETETIEEILVRNPNIENLVIEN